MFLRFWEIYIVEKIISIENIILATRLTFNNLI